MSFTDTISSTRYQHWVASQLEPDQSVLRGSGKRYEPIKVPVLDKVDKLTEAEKDRMNDEHLKQYGL